MNKFYDNALSVERDKLYYFTLVRNQKTLVISAPTDNKEQKIFLGYDWSNRKGSEGIIINKKGGQLYDDSNRFASDTLASLIRFTFYGDISVRLPEEIEKFAKTYWLKDMIDFSQTKHEKILRTTVIDKFEIKSKYPLVTLDDIVELNPSKSEIRDIPNDTIVSFVEMASVSNDGYISNMVDRKLGDLRSGGYTYFAENDIIIAKITPCMENGKCAIATGLTNKIALGSSEFHVFRCSKEINKSFLFSLLNMKNVRNAAILNMTGASGHRRVPESFYRSLQIPLPPLDIQQKIVEECKKVDEYKLNALKILEDSKKEIDSIVLPCFDNYPKVVLKTICDSFEYGTSEKSSTSGAVPVLRMGNIVDGSIDWSDLVYTDNMQDIKKHSLKKNDILFNRTNSPIYVGKTALYEDERPAIFAGYLVRVNYQRDKIRGKYLSYILNSEPIMQHGFSVMTKSVNQANISASLLAQYEIPLPSLDEQDEIINKLEAIERRKKQSIATIANTPSSKQAILDKYLK